MFNTRYPEHAEMYKVQMKVQEVTYCIVRPCITVPTIIARKARGLSSRKHGQTIYLVEPILISIFFKYFEVTGRCLIKILGMLTFLYYNENMTA